MPSVCDARQLIDERLGHIADDGEATAHVAVEGAVAYGELALISGRQDERAPFIGKSHECGAAQSGLEVLLCDIAGDAAEEGIEHPQKLLVHGRYRHNFEADSQIMRKR